MNALCGTAGRDRNSQRYISPRLIETATPDVQKAIQDANLKDEINFAEEMEQINFYSRALGLLLWVRDGSS